MHNRPGLHRAYPRSFSFGHHTFVEWVTFVAQSAIIVGFSAWLCSF